MRPNPFVQNSFIIKLTLLVSTCINQLVIAQNSALIGYGSLTGTSLNNSTGDSGPMYRSNSTSNYIYSSYHYLYTATELANAGLTAGSTIYQLSWNKTNNAGTYTNCKFEVWIKNSTLTDVGLAGQSWTTLINGATNVYLNPTHVVVNQIGWQGVIFNSPFLYTGGALEISTSFTANGTSPWTTGGFSWRRDTISHVTLSYCGSSPSTILGNLRTVRPFTLILFSPALGIKKETKKEPLELSIFPNPSIDITRLNIQNCSNENAVLSIYSLDSQLQTREEIFPTQNQIEYTLDLSNYSKGIYFVQLKNKSSLVTKKLIVN